MASSEVELVLADHPGVAEVAVLGVPHERWGEVGCAVVVPAGGARVGVADLEDHCRGRLARYKIPKRVVHVDALPRTALGKVRKDELRRVHLQGDDR